MQEILRAWNAVSPCKDKPSLLAESAGCLTSLGVAIKSPELIHSIILGNPATAYPRTLWPILGTALANMGQNAPFGKESVSNVLKTFNVTERAKELGLYSERSLGEFAFLSVAGPVLAFAAMDQTQIEKLGVYGNGVLRELGQSFQGNGKRTSAQIFSETIGSLDVLVSCFVLNIIPMTTLWRGKDVRKPTLSRLLLPQHR